MPYSPKGKGIAMDPEKITQLATKIANHTDTDVILFNGALKRPRDLEFFRMCRAQRRRKNALVIVVTQGGDADVAYRIGRQLQDKYERVTAFIPGYCKSAGTLLVIAANDIIMTDLAELGPLDVQLAKTDDLFERSSGLTFISAFNSLQVRAVQMFEDTAIRIKRRSGGQITFKTAADMSSRLAVGLLTPIYAQIDPNHVGEASRAMQIAEDYGARLDEKPDNLTVDALARLAGGYSSHSFVIDRREASRLFRRVRAPSDDEQALADELEQLAIAHFRDGDDVVCTYLSDPPQDAAAKRIEESHEHRGDHGADQAQAGTAPAVGETAGGKAEDVERKPEIRIVGGSDSNN